MNSDDDVRQKTGSTHGMIEDWTNEIHQGDAFDVLAELPEESVHAVVCDPPYGLAFMERSWDTFAPTEYQDWCRRWGELAMDVLKPGGHLLAFSGNRTTYQKRETNSTRDDFE